MADPKAVTPDLFRGPGLPQDTVSRPGKPGENGVLCRLWTPEQVRGDSRGAGQSASIAEPVRDPTSACYNASFLVRHL